MKRAFIVLSAFALATCFLGKAEASVNLVVNGGFESGMSGWNVQKAWLGSDIGVGSKHHSGRHAAQFGAWLWLEDTIRQTIPTVAGQFYTFDFWLKHAMTDCMNEFTASWNGAEVLELDGASCFEWTHYSFTEEATGSSTVIAFSGRELPSYYYLDDVCVSVNPDVHPNTPVPEPATAVLWSGLGLVGLVTVWRRRMRAA
jgi:hypothetical protein